MEANRLPEYCHIDAAQQGQSWALCTTNEVWILTNCRSLGDLGMSEWVEVIFQMHGSTFLWWYTCTEERVRGSGVGGGCIRSAGCCGRCLRGRIVNSGLYLQLELLPFLSCP